MGFLHSKRAYPRLKPLMSMCVCVCVLCVCESVCVCGCVCVCARTCNPYQPGVLTWHPTLRLGMHTKIGMVSKQMLSCHKWSKKLYIMVNVFVSRLQMCRGLWIQILWYTHHLWSPIVPNCLLCVERRVHPCFCTSPVWEGLYSFSYMPACVCVCVRVRACVCECMHLTNTYLWGLENNYQHNR